MTAAIAEMDWSETPLGPIETWPAALKIAVSMLVSSSFPKCLCWGPNLITIYNSAFIPILGEKHPCLGLPFSQIWAEAWGSIGPIANKALAGEATFIRDYPLVIDRFGQAEEAYFTFCYSPVRDESGKVCGMLDTVIETTETIRANQAWELRNRELIHRSRNAYALVSALVSQTHRHSSTLEEAQTKVQARLASLNRALDLLAHDAADVALISDVVDKALEPFQAENALFTATGPAARIGGDQATALSLALHELATNASKYGALSVPEGRVSIHWTVARAADGQRFTLDWAEHDGPPVSRVDRQGFGSFLVRQALPSEFRGEVTLDFPPEGVRMRLTGLLDTLG